MAIRTERVPKGPESIYASGAVLNVAERAFSDLVRHFPELGVTEREVADLYEDIHSAPGKSFWRAAAGYAVNRLGSRPAQMYTAHDGDEIIGWLTTAADYSNNHLHRMKKSYLWLVNGGVHPEYQRRGVMSTLLERALTDPRRPHVTSITTHVSAYPIVAPPESGIILPAEAGLQHLGFEQTGDPFEDSATFGKPTLLRRYEGASPDEVAQKLS